jgi:hypothetical protein
MAVTRDAMSIVFAVGGHAVGPRPRRVMLDSLEVDATLTDSVTGSNELTQHPIETGSTVSDHVIVKPRQYRMEGIVSNAPASGAERVDAVRADWAGLDGDSPTGKTNKVDGAYSLLEEMLQLRDVVTVATPLRVYTDMVMVSLQITRDRNTGDALHFTAEFQQVIKAKSATVAPAAIPRAESTKQTGRLPSGAASKPVESNTTLLRLGTDSIGFTPKD